MARKKKLSRFTQQVVLMDRAIDFVALMVFRQIGPCLETEMRSELPLDDEEAETYRSALRFLGNEFDAAAERPDPLTGYKP